LIIFKSIKISLAILGLIGFFYTNILLAESNNKKNTKIEEKGISRFFLDYAVVEHSLKNDKGYSIKLLELYKKNPNSAIFLADFWHYKAVKECYKFMKETAHFYSEKISIDMTEGQKDKIMEPAKEAIDHCFYGFYYDNWDEINRTIVNKLKAEGLW